MTAALRVSILSSPQCPHLPLLHTRLRTAMEATGVRHAQVRLRQVRNLDEARLLQFTGSPTLWLNGEDPFRDPDASPSLACRTYGDGDGRSSLPSLQQLIQAIAFSAQQQHPRPRS
jgi:hypothetical protein